MTVSKSRQAITQLTASGTSTTLDVSSSPPSTLFLRHNNGTGSVTAAASARVDLQTKGGSAWFALDTYTFTTTAASLDDRVVDIPAGVASVRVVYTQPTGPTGFGLDAEVGTESYS